MSNAFAKHGINLITVPPPPITPPAPPTASTSTQTAAAQWYNQSSWQNLANINADFKRRKDEREERRVRACWAAEKRSLLAWKKRISEKVDKAAEVEMPEVVVRWFVRRAEKKGLLGKEKGKRQRREVVRELWRKHLRILQAAELKVVLGRLGECKRWRKDSKVKLEEVPVPEMGLEGVKEGGKEKESTTVWLTPAGAAARRKRVGEIWEMEQGLADLVREVNYGKSGVERMEPSRLELLLHLEPSDILNVGIPISEGSTRTRQGRTTIALHIPLLKHYSNHFKEVLEWRETFLENLYPHSKGTSIYSNSSGHTSYHCQRQSPNLDPWHIGLLFCGGNSTIEKHQIDLYLPRSISPFLPLFLFFIYNGLPTKLLTAASLPTLQTLLNPRLTPPPPTSESLTTFLLHGALLGTILGADEFTSSLLHTLDFPSCPRRHGLFILPPPDTPPKKYCPCTSILPLSTYFTLVSTIYSTLYHESSAPTCPPTWKFRNNGFSRLNPTSPHNAKRFWFRYACLRTGATANCANDLIRIVAFSAARYVDRLKNEELFLEARRAWWGRKFFADVAGVWYRGKWPVEETLREVERKLGIVDVGESFMAPMPTMNTLFS